MLEPLRDRIELLKPFYEKNCLHDIFSWKELEMLLNFRPSNTQNRFTVYLKERYEWPDQAWVSDINSFPPSILEKIIKKYLCHIVDSSRVNKKINYISGELETITGFPTDAHLYVDLTDQQNVGFGIHYDYAHNLIVQIEGKSKVRAWGFKVPDGSKTVVENLEEEPLFEFVMEPGDIIYVPAYYYHEVKSITKRLSVSFPSSTLIQKPFQERNWIDLNL